MHRGKSLIVFFYAYLEYCSVVSQKFSNKIVGSMPSFSLTLNISIDTSYT